MELVQEQYKLARCLVQGMRFAFLIARGEKAQEVQTRHVLGGILLGCWDVLRPFWKSGDDVEEFMEGSLKMNQPRQYYWIRLYNQDHAFFRRDAEIWRYSNEWAAIEKNARQLAHNRNAVKTESPPAISAEDYLMAVAQSNSPLGTELIKSGLDVHKLRAATGSNVNLDGLTR